MGLLLGYGVALLSAVPQLQEKPLALLVILRLKIHVSVEL